MKKIKYLVLLFVVIFSFGCKNAPNTTKEKIKKPTTGINWMTIEQAEQAVKKKPKDIYIMVHANWCPKCQKFKETTYMDPKVINDLNKYFYPVMVNAHNPNTMTFKGKKYGNPDFDITLGIDEQNSYHELLYDIGARSIPAIVFLDKDLTVVGSEMGFKEAGELRSLMKMYGSY